jgi:hypothetical protein
MLARRRHIVSAAMVRMPDTDPRTTTAQLTTCKKIINGAIPLLVVSRRRSAVTS